MVLARERNSYNLWIWEFFYLGSLSLVIFFNLKKIWTDGMILEHFFNIFRIVKYSLIFLTFLWEWNCYLPLSKNPGKGGLSVKLHGNCGDWGLQDKLVRTIAAICSSIVSISSSLQPSQSMLSSASGELFRRRLKNWQILLEYVRLSLFLFIFWCWGNFYLVRWARNMFRSEWQMDCECYNASSDSFLVNENFFC